MSNNTASAKIRIHASAAAVLSVFTEADKMSRFWFARSDDGMMQGESVTFTIGSGETAFSFDAYVAELDFPNKLVLQWNGPHSRNTVTFICTESENSTVLSIEEVGFGGDDETIVSSVLDSTGGFNQVIVAAKALVEHGIALNVVNDHA